MYQRQQERLEAETAKERELLANMLNGRAKGANDRLSVLQDGPAGARSSKARTAVVIATVETRFCLNTANFDRSSRMYATMLKVRNHGAVWQTSAFFRTIFYSQIASRCRCGMVRRCPHLLNEREDLYC